MSEAHAGRHDARRELPFSFSGRAGEYFGIWIVNLLLTILTIGIYSAWAKVRTNRYFYGNTSVDGVSLEYHAKPMQILIGRMIALAVYAVVGTVSNFFPLALIVIVPLFFLLVPWVILRSLRFNARMTSWRNVRFNFAGSYGWAFMAFVVWPLAGFITLGLLWPLAAKRGQSFLVDNARFGGKAFNSFFTAGDFYRIYAIGLLILIVLAALFVAAVLLPLLGVQGPVAGSGTDLVGVLVAFGFVFVGIYVGTMVTNLTFNCAALEGGHGFRSTMSPWMRLWIAGSNLLLVIVSLGLLFPWTRIRQVRYRASRTAVLAASDLTEFTSEIIEGQSAIGEEIGEVFDIEVGF